MCILRRPISGTLHAYHTLQSSMLELLAALVLSQEACILSYQLDATLHQMRN